MSPLDIDTVLSWRGRTVLDRDGERIGKLGDIYLDRRSDRPAWAKVGTGLFGRKESFIPLEDAEPAGEDLRVPYAKDHVGDAPRVDPEVELGEDEEAALFRHYGRDEPPAAQPLEDERAAPAVADEREDEARPVRGAGGVRAGDPEDERDSAAADEPRTAPDDEGSAEIVRSEEEIRVGTRWEPTERLRLKKVLVSDHVEREVPVRREHVVVERDPPAEG
jgi:sporulation protein YlmC with PRC-barrel domain